MTRTEAKRALDRAFDAHCTSEQVRAVYAPSSQVLDQLFRSARECHNRGFHDFAEVFERAAAAIDFEMASKLRSLAATEPPEQDH